MADDMGERTEAPTQRKREDARDRGQVARSPDLAAAVDLIAAVLLIVLFGAALATTLGRVLADSLRPDAQAMVPASAGPLLVGATVRASLAAAPILALLFVAGVAAHVLQVGLHFSTRPLVPDLSRLNPVAGLGRLLGRRSLIKTLSGLLKVAAVVVVAWLVLRDDARQVAALPRLSLWAGVSTIGDLALRLALWLLVTLLILGVADFLYQRWQHTQDLRMTKEEVKDERRSMEGDPKVKGQRFKLARQIALQRINQAVPQADVIVTNPTHFAVALRYDESTMRAPKVVAKGADLLAMRIRQVAAMHRVPIVERPPLARALYAGVEVGREIRPEFYEAVAEVLAYVYRLDSQAA